MNTETRTVKKISAMKVEGLTFPRDVDVSECPFCQSLDLSFRSYLSDGWIECNDCGCHGPHDYLAQVFLEKCEGNAIDTWNDRDACDYDFILRVLTLIRKKDLHSVFYWKTDGDAAPLTFFLNCNDLIAWGSADAEDITPDNIERFEKTIEECESIDSDDGAIIGCDLFVCRERKMRPQGACYPEDRRFWPLFDACGPEREVGLGNPFAPGSAA